MASDQQGKILAQKKTEVSRTKKKSLGQKS